MKHILLILFAIIVFFSGSNSEIYALENQEKDTLLIAYVESIDENHRENSPNQKFEEKEVSQPKPYASKVAAENEFRSEDIREESFAFELVFFLFMLISMAFLALVHFYGYNERADTFQQFD